MNTFSKDEMRAIRREWINIYIQDFMRFHLVKSQKLAKWFVRFQEVRNYGRELKAYS